MPATSPFSCSAFAGSQRIASGSLVEVARVVKAAGEGRTPVLVFDDHSGRIVELDLRGSMEDVIARLAPSPAGEEGARRPGRPKLGVVAREVTLLPRHWDWLASQPGGASVALRRLVDEARKANSAKDRLRDAQEAAYRLMHAMAGDAPGFEEASRALFASDFETLGKVTAGWPGDVGDQITRMLDVGREGMTA